jgi:sec-independent protein translocase protein TatA
MNTFVLAGIVGPWQIVLIVVIVLLLFGGKKIPELMKGLGQGMKEFKNAVKEKPEEKETPSKKEDIKEDDKQ